MKKSFKVKKLIDQNGIEVQNFTMVIRLKKIIEQLNLKIQQQQCTIMQLKRDSKTTKINEMEVQIQHLNDENKRLVIMIDEMKQMIGKKELAYGFVNKFTLSGGQKDKERHDYIKMNQTSSSGNLKHFTKKKKSPKKDSTNGSLFGSGFMSMTNSLGHKKTYPQAQKQKEQLLKEQMKQKKFEKKYYQLLEQTQKLKKELINLRLNELNTTKKSKASQDKNSQFIEKNIEQLQKISQKKHDLEVQNQLIKKKLNQSEKKSRQLEKENQLMRKMTDQLKSQIKCKNLLNSEKVLIGNKSQVLKQIGNIDNQNKVM